MYSIADPDKLTGRVNLRVTQSELAQLREDADLAGLSLSELIRRRYFGLPIIARSDEIAIRELRRQGGLLKHVLNEAGGIYSVEVSDALKAVTIAIEMLAKSKK